MNVVTTKAAKIAVLVTGLCTLVAGCSTAPGKSLVMRPQAQILEAGLLPDQVALVMLPLAHSAAPLRFNAATPLQPASTLKLLTTVVALETLGRTWRGETQLRLAVADVGQSRLQQPLLVRGLADTDLDYGQLWLLLRQLYDTGVRDIPAGLQFDRRLFQPLRPTASAEPFDDSPRSRYNHVPDALMLQQNMHLLSINTTAGLQVQLTPHWPHLQLDSSQLQPVTADCDSFNFHQLNYQLKHQLQNPAPAQIQHQPQSVSTATQQLQLSGQVPIGCNFSSQLELLDRDINLQLAIRGIWQQLGGTMGPALQFSDATTATSPENTVLVVQHLGRPLPEIVSRINKTSDNALARLLYQTIGAQSAPVPTSNASEAPLPLQASAQATAQASLQSSTDLADARVQQWFAAHQINTDGLVVDNGSGLSRLARISAWQLASVLQQAWHGSYHHEIITSLPLAGVDGTLAQRFLQGPAWQRARLKTGTLRNVTALAGYVWDSQGQPWVFVGIVNDPAASRKGRALLDRWVEQLAAH